MSDKFPSIGVFTSHLSAAYKAHAAPAGDDSDRDKKTWLTRAFAEAKLPISTTQASQILQAAAQSRQICCREQEEDVQRTAHTLTPSPACLSWGEFCVCCAEIQSLQQFRQTHPSEHNHSGGNGRTGKVSPPSPHGLPETLSCKYDVFLGGSCNPTSWRKDVVIPQLKREGITYYNPQVDEWYPELIEIEEQAKEAASKLFYVVDNQTRAVASMVEISYYAGCGRDMLVVVDDIVGDNSAIGGDRLSPREVEDLNRGRAFVRNIAALGGSLLESTVHQAVCSLLDVSRWGQSLSEHSQSQRLEWQKTSHSLGSELRLLRQVFSMYDTEGRGKLTLQEVELALQSLNIEENIVRQLRSRSESCDESHDHWLLWKQEGTSCEEFCMLYSEAKYLTLRQRWPRSLLGLAVGSISSALHHVSNWLWSTPPAPLTPHPHHSHSPNCDVFLGGSCGSTSWRRDDIIPILRQYGVSFFNPQVSLWDTRLIPVEEKAKEQCSVLLFVLTGSTLSVASMVEVAYYIGCGRRLVLALSDIPWPEEGSCTSIEGMELSLRAVKDYNRGRAYLTSIANKKHVAIFSDPVDAALCAVYMVKGYEIPSVKTVPLRGTSV